MKGNSIKTYVTQLCFLCLSAWFSGNAYSEPTWPEKLPTLNLRTRSSHFISAPVSEIWPYITDTVEWKAGAQLVPWRGAPHESGARFKAVLPDDRHTILFFAENVEVVPERRRTLKLLTPDGGLLGFASWLLSAEESGTSVEYHVYTKGAIPESLRDGTAAEELPVLEQRFREQSAARFSAELEILEDLVTGRRH